MAAVYDQILTDQHNPKKDVSYTSASPSVDYPLSDTYNVFGPVYLPKVYGKDLTAFELGSSGSIAVTLKDVYAFDLALGDQFDSQKVVFNTTGDKPLALVSGSIANVTINSRDALVDLYSASNLTALAKSVVQLSTDSNVSIQMRSDSNGTMMLTAGSNTSFFMNGDAGSVQTFGQLSAKIGTDNSYMTVTSNIAFVAQSNVTTDCGAVLTSSAIGSNARLVLDGPAMTATLSGLSNVALKAGSTISLDAPSILFNGGDMNLGSSNLMLGGSNAYVHINDSNLDLYALNQIHFMASNNTIYENQKSFVLNTSNLAITASDSVSTSAASSIAFAASNFSVSVSNSASVSAASNLAFAGQTVQVTASSNLDISTVYAHTVHAQSLSETVNTFSATATDYTVAASNSFVVTSASIGSISAIDLLTLNGSNRAVFKAGEQSQLVALPDTLTARMAGSNVLIVSSSNVTVNGELIVNGDIKSVTTYEETLQIFDKSVTLSAGASNGVFMDGVANNGSGLIVAGMPSANGVDLINDTPLYEKSLKFNCPSSAAMMRLADGSNVAPTASFDAESFWELKGGDFRITLMKSDTDFITFGWRIGAFGELELIKKYQFNGVWRTKIVSRQGRIVDPSTGGVVY